MSGDLTCLHVGYLSQNGGEAKCPDLSRSGGHRSGLDSTGKQLDNNNDQP